MVHQAFADGEIVPRRDPQRAPGRRAGRCRSAAGSVACRTRRRRARPGRRGSPHAGRPRHGDPDGAVAVEDDPVDERLGQDGEVRARPGSPDRGDEAAHPDLVPPVARPGPHHPVPRVRGVEVGCEAEADLEAGLDEHPLHRLPELLRVGRDREVALGRLEVRQHLLERPAGAPAATQAPRSDGRGRTATQPFVIDEPPTRRPRGGARCACRGRTGRSRSPSRAAGRAARCRRPRAP